MVVDPCLLPEEVLEIKQFVEHIQRDRPLILAFTHSDFDHIIGYKAFKPDKVITSAYMDSNPNKQAVIEEAECFDQRYYIARSYPLEYPEATFKVYQDEAYYRHGGTRMAFYLAPGHTSDGLFIIVWQLGLCIVGDYLSNLEFPLINFSSEAYIHTLEKLQAIHDRNWFTRIVPGHGRVISDMGEWIRRRNEHLAYIYALRESIATGIPFDEDSLWYRYNFQLELKELHRKNMAFMTEEYREGKWTYDPNILALSDHSSEQEPAFESDNDDDGTHEE